MIWKLCIEISAASGLSLSYASIVSFPLFFLSSLCLSFSLCLSVCLSLSLFLSLSLTLSPPSSLLSLPPPLSQFSVDVIECMSCSDNVVRAGLTPKYRDSDTLCKMLTYNCRTASENMFHPHPHPDTPQVTIYNPPAPEFAVAKVSLPGGTREFSLPVVQGPSILLLMKGSGEMRCESETGSYRRGDVVFLPADHQLTVFPTVPGNDEGTLLFQAYCELWLQNKLCETINFLIRALWWFYSLFIHFIINWHRFETHILQSYI